MFHGVLWRFLASFESDPGVSMECLVLAADQRVFLWNLEPGLRIPGSRPFTRYPSARGGTSEKFVDVAYDGAPCRFLRLWKLQVAPGNFFLETFGVLRVRLLKT